MLTLAEKSNYVIHYKSLQFYLKQGMRLKMVHRVIEFEQEPCMEPYIQMNTGFRKAAEANFYKLMNNSVLSKTMRNRIDVKIVCSWKTDKICSPVASSLYARREIFGNNLAGINMHKMRLFFDKPIYTGMIILENSKNLIYDFFYNQMKTRYGQNPS